LYCIQINRSATAVSKLGDTQTVKVTALSESCQWAATPSVPWISATGPSPRSGAGTLQFTVAPNPTGSLREGFLMVASGSIVVRQAPAGCEYQLGTQSGSVPKTGGEFTLSVTAAPGCGWGTSTSSIPWVQLPHGAEGYSGSGVLGYRVAANTDRLPRTGAVQIAGQILQIEQAGDDPPIFFSDVPFSLPGFNHITILRARQITSGCAVDEYCPGSGLTRSQMAVFLVRSLLGDSFEFRQTPSFDDVPVTHQHFRYVQKMGELAITSGCSLTEYCPEGLLTRGQMAVFVIRARLGVRAGDSFAFPPKSFFDDVPETHPFFSFIQKMKELGISENCAPNRFCPEEIATRGQMAVAVVRGLLTP
jgi:hypothetical protein